MKIYAIKIGAIASFADNVVVFQALIVAASWSRALMVVAAAWLRPIEGDPVADHFLQPPGVRVARRLGTTPCTTRTRRSASQAGAYAIIGVHGPSTWASLRGSPAGQRFRSPLSRKPRETVRRW